MAGENVIIQPKNGKVSWNGYKYVYTPNQGFFGRDSYVISKINLQSGLTETQTINVEIPNIVPTANNIALTAYARDLAIQIDVTDYISDADNLLEPLKISRVESIPSAFITYSDNIIYIVPKGVDAIETFNYYVTDGQNDTSAAITLTLTGGVVRDLPQYIVDNIDDLGLKVSRIAAASSTWNDSYTFVQANSTKLDGLDVDRYNATSSVVEANSANWDELHSKIPVYDSTNALVASKSASWDATIPVVNNVRTNVQSNSSVWNSTNNLLASNSANWDNTFSRINSLSSAFELKRPVWDSVTSTVSSNSANWNVSQLRSSIASNSAKWEDTYSVVQTNSASWGALTYKTPIYDAAVTTLTNASGSWDNARNFVAANSAIWDSGASIIASNSGRWLSGGSDLNFTSFNMTVCGDLVVAGSLTAQGTTTQINANLVATSAFNIVNIGALDAMTVDKTLSQGALAKFTTNNASNTVMIVNSGRVGINTSNPNEALTVNGNISASGTIFGNIPPEYTVFRANSGKYESTFTYLTGASANLNGLLSDKPKYDQTVTYLTNNSAAISTGLQSIKTLDDVRNVVQSQSANNIAAYNLIATTSASIGKDALYQLNKADYDRTVTYFQSNSSQDVSINFIFDGSGRFIFSGSNGIVSIPSKVKINSCSVYGVVEPGQDAIMKIDILSSSNASYPTFVTICSSTGNAAVYPTLTGVNVSKSDPNTNGWKTILDRGTILKFVATTTNNTPFILTRNASVTLNCTKTV